MGSGERERLPDRRLNSELILVDTSAIWLSNFPHICASFSHKFWGSSRIPKITTLKGHPGWTPTYRGLGSILFQMRDGYLPSLTVHGVDGGVDTGPIISRAILPATSFSDYTSLGEAIKELRVEEFARAIHRIKDGKLRFIDTFLEPSNLYRGMNLREQEKVRKLVENQRHLLKSPAEMLHRAKAT